MINPKRIILVIFMLSSSCLYADIGGQGGIGFMDNSGSVNHQTISASLQVHHNTKHKHLQLELDNLYKEFNDRKVSNEHTLNLTGKFFLPINYDYFIKTNIRLHNNEYDKVGFEEIYSLALGYRFSKQPYLFKTSIGVSKHKIDYYQSNSYLNQTALYFNLKASYPISKNLKLSVNSSFFHGSQVSKKHTNLQITSSITKTISLAFKIKYQYNSDQMSPITHSRQTQLQFIYKI